jgi:hypothetical protein
MLFAGTDPNASLTGLTAHGRLNLYNSVQLVQQYCGNACPAPYGLAVAGQTDTSANLQWAAPSTADSFAVRWRPVGGSTWQQAFTNADSLFATGLNTCTWVEFEVAAYCAGSPTSWSASLAFETEGCCRPPQTFAIDNLTQNQGTVRIPPTYGSTQSWVRYRAQGASQWDTLSTSADSLLLSGLNYCTSYEVEIMPQCGALAVGWSNPQTFITQGCGACRDFTYCPMALDATEEWIETFALDTFSFTSGSDGGYGDHTGQLIGVEAGLSYPVSIVPGFANFSLTETYRIWIDANADGDFSDPGELIFDPQVPTNGTMVGQLTIPSNATAGITRLRVVQHWNTLASNACYNLGYGEVEDYCIEIAGYNAIQPPKEVARITLSPNPTQSTAQLNSELPIQTVLCQDLAGRICGEWHPTGNSQILDIGGLPQGIYLLSVQVQGNWQHIRMVRQ